MKSTLIMLTQVRCTRGARIAAVADPDVRAAALRFAGLDDPQAPKLPDPLAMLRAVGFDV